MWKFWRKDRYIDCTGDRIGIAGLSYSCHRGTCCSDIANWIWFSIICNKARLNIPIFIQFCSVQLNIATRWFRIPYILRRKSERLLVARGCKLLKSHTVCVWWMNECGTMVEWYWQGKRAVAQNPVPVPLCPAPLSRRLTWDRNRAYAVTSRGG